VRKYPDVDYEHEHVKRVDDRHMLRYGVCFSKKYRSRRMYDNDAVVHEEKALKCNKDFKSSALYNGGIATYTCKHRICYGFSTINGKEGKFNVFTLMHDLLQLLLNSNRTQ
jgi:hypothetical protein